ncbi:MAG: hypothetical protein ACOZQL_36265 [Myxococcota bacterium]
MLSKNWGTRTAQGRLVSSRRERAARGDVDGVGHERLRHRATAGVSRRGERRDATKTAEVGVDSSPVIEDVFVDLYGNGVRRWHTVLVASNGGTSERVISRCGVTRTAPGRPVSS